MVSMKDVSKKCGVSIATVSKALNDHNDIGEATKERIREVAKEMGYFPNSSARALKTNRTYNLGVLFVDEARNGLTHDYFARVLDSFKVRAEECGYDITFISRATRGNMSYYEHSKYRGVDGVVIACVNFYAPEVLELIRSDLPIVTIDHVFDNRSAVVSDNIKGIEDLVHYIYGQGHRKIAYIHGADSSVTQNRLSSFYRTMDRLGLEVPDAYVKKGIYRDVGLAAELTRELLDLKNRPTCILYPDDYSSLGGINVIRERNLKIPDDISIAGFDGIPIAKVLEPKLTTLEQNTYLIGRKAASKLIKLIENPKTTLTEKIVIEGRVLEGSSVGKLN